MNDLDHSYVGEALFTEPQPLKKCKIFLPDQVLKRFASYFTPETPFPYILLRLYNISKLNGGLFFLSSLKD